MAAMGNSPRQAPEREELTMTVTQSPQQDGGGQGIAAIFERM
jgi:hypothetical protein